jgi:PEP-CTERM motif
MRAALVAASTLLGLTVCTWVDASPITWHVTGEVGAGNEGDFFFPFTAHAGDPIAIDFSFESEAPCVICEDGFRTYDNALLGITLSVRDTRFALPVTSSSIGIRNDWQSPAGSFVDGFSLFSEGTDPSGIAFTSSLNMQNTAPSSPVPGFDTAELRNLRPPDASIFADPSFSFWNFSASFDGGFDELGGKFQSASEVSVPEPSTLALLAVGTMLVGSFRYRTARRARSKAH